MKVAAITSDGDWQFGRSLSGYVQGHAAVKQLVVTRLREWVNDWFLDTSAGIDWRRLLSGRNTRDAVLGEVRRVVLGTEGVLTLDFLDVVETPRTRAVRISIRVGTIYDTVISEQIEVLP